ncbi:hypothetical protein [Bacillus mesophilum]|nr:hypothetical protein [Bacillus mesophilum]
MISTTISDESGNMTRVVITPEEIKIEAKQIDLVALKHRGGNHND